MSTEDSSLNNLNQGFTSTPACGGGRRSSIILSGRPRSGTGSSLQARRRSRSRGTSASSSVTFDLALEIPPEAVLQQLQPELERQLSCSSTRHVHRIEQESQLIVRECFRQALIPRVSAQQAGQIEEVLECGAHVENAVPACRCDECASIATGITALTAEMRSTRRGQEVIRRVNRVNLQSLGHADFEIHMAALANANRSSGSRARIGVILLFCTELALTAVQTSDRLAFCQVLNWSMDYFRKTVSAWVVRAGGWDKVSQEPTKVVASVAFALTVLLLGRAILRLIRGI